MEGYILKTMSDRIISTNDLSVGDVLVLTKPHLMSVGGGGLQPLEMCKIARVDRETISFDIIYDGVAEELYSVRTALKRELPQVAIFYDAPKMNRKLSDLQIKAYTNCIDAGDAVWQGGVWWEVKKERDRRGFAFLVTDSRHSIYQLSLDQYEEDYCTVTTANLGYRYSEDNALPYRVTLLSEHYLTGGEKLVWLGETDRRRTFGEIYNSPLIVEGERISGEYILKKSADGQLCEYYNGWAVIPKYSPSLNR